MARLTPPLNATGRFTVAAPFDTVIFETVAYQAIALRRFTDIIELGEDIYEKYYAPRGLTEVQFKQDERANVVIVSLMNPSGEVWYVPDSYILSYPNQGDVKYQHVVLSVSLGPLPDYLPLDFAMSQIASVASDTIGVTAVAKLHVAPTVGTVTPEQHEILETARALRITNRKTDRAKAIEAVAQVTALQQRIAVLETIIVEAGLLPP
jgi:hypothetical protein